MNMWFYFFIFFILLLLIGKPEKVRASIHTNVATTKKCNLYRQQNTNRWENFN